MKEIPLTQGKVARIDDQDFDLISRYKWRARLQDGTHWYARAWVSLGGKKKKCIQMHRLVLGLTDPGVFADHKNRDTLDNRRCNLRAVTPAANSYNKGIARCNTTGFKGVSAPQKYRHRSRPFSAAIKIKGQSIWLGLHESAELAARAYDAKARELFGEFAYLNFP